MNLVEHAHRTVELMARLESIGIGLDGRDGWLNVTVPDAALDAGLAGPVDLYHAGRAVIVAAEQYVRRVASGESR